MTEATSISAEPDINRTTTPAQMVPPTGPSGMQQSTVTWHQTRHHQTQVGLVATSLKPYSHHRDTWREDDDDVGEVREVGLRRLRPR